MMLDRHDEYDYDGQVEVVEVRPYRRRPFGLKYGFKGRAERDLEAVLELEQISNAMDLEDRLRAAEERAEEKWD